MITFNFTKKSIIELPATPSGQQIEYGDTTVIGLRIRVGASGIKSFCVARRRDGKFIRVTLGRFPEMTIEVARMKALEALGEVAVTRRNPNERRREDEGRAITLRAALDEYKKSRAGRIKKSTADQYERLLSNFSGDWLETPLASIDRASVEARHVAITAGGVWFGSEPQRGDLRAGVASGEFKWSVFLD